MELHDTVAGLRGVLDPVRTAGGRVGMVGTSGAMHDGHLSLIRRSAADNDVTALYWGGGAGFGWMTSQIDYARDAGRDFALAEQAGCDLVFSPRAEEFFPREPMTKVSLPAMSRDVAHLEDPAHLDLIAMVMCRLWNMFGPCRNYSGEKDWQQLAMFKRLAEDLYMPVEVVGCPTVREADGVAVSSRNGQLNAEQRAAAPVLYRALTAAARAAEQGARRTADLEAAFTEAVGGRAETRYFTVVGADTMKPVDDLGGSLRLLGSIQLGGVRLLDNVGVDLN